MHQHSLTCCAGSVQTRPLTIIFAEVSISFPDHVLPSTVPLIAITSRSLSSGETPHRVFEDCQRPAKDAYKDQDLYKILKGSSKDLQRSLYAKSIVKILKDLTKIFQGSYKDP